MAETAGFVILIGGVIISAAAVFYTGSILGIIPLAIALGYGVLA
jgi:hypothetical protein